MVRHVCVRFAAWAVSVMVVSGMASLSHAGGHKTASEADISPKNERVITAEDMAANFERLDDAQKALSARMETFMAEMDARYFARAEAMNGGQVLEEKDFVTNTYDYNIKVARGPVMEKIGRMYSVGKIDQRGTGELLWGRFYSIDAHPKTPLVGMLHATIVVQHYPDGMTQVGGWLGVMPGTKIDEDLAKLKQVMDAAFDERDLDVTFYRDLICDGDPEEIRREFRRRPACVGASFYARPAYKDPNEQFTFVSETFKRFTDAYMDIVEARQNDPFTDDDIAAQDEMRKRWLIDQLFSDPFASALVPFEVWSMANVPPVIKF